MRYFEIHDPYYALIRALTKEEAVQKYIGLIADDKENRLIDEIQEVDRDYALLLFGRGLTEERADIPISKILEEFEKRGNEILLVDSALV